MDNLERKEGRFVGDMGGTIAFDTKALSDEGEFDGYASVFNHVDFGKDMVMPGAFTDSLKSRPAGKVKMLLQHDTWQPIGVWTEMSEDANGLKVKGKLLLNTQNGQETHEFLKAGALEGLSIGYRTLVEEYDRENEVRKLVKIDLREVSVVTFPMNDRATVSTIKGGDRIPSIREMEQHLTRDAGLSAAHAKALLADGYKSIQDARDAGSVDEDGFIEAMNEFAEKIRG